MITIYFQKFRLFSRNARLFLIVWTLSGFSYMGVYSVLLNLYLLRLGYGPEFIGLVNGVGFLAFAVFSLPAGGMDRRWGSRRMIIVGVILAGSGLVLLPLAEFISSLQAVWILSAYSLAFLAIAFYVVNANPFLMSSTDTEERNHVFSVWQALNPLTGFAGNLVGGFLPGIFAMMLGVSLKHPAAYRFPLLIAGVLYILSSLILLRTRQVGVSKEKTVVGEAVTSPYGLIILMALVSLLRGAGMWPARTFFNVYLDANLHAPTTLIGTLMAISQLLAVPAVLAMPFLSQFWGKGRTVVFGSLGTAFSLLPLALIPHWIAAGFGLMGVITLSLIGDTAFLVFSQEIVSPSWRAVMSGAINMAGGLCSSAMSFGGGYIITALGYRSLFLTAACLTAAGGLLFWAYLRTCRGKSTRSSSTDKDK